MIFQLGELFSGPGGLAKGATNVRFRHNNEEWGVNHGWANDIDLDSCATYINNIPDANNDNVICQDVTRLDIEALPEINAFAYGFPCNDFSLVGEQKGFDGKFGPLYTYGVKVNNKFNPRFFVAENVGGITSANKGSALKRILNDLENSGDLGYNLIVHLYKSEHYNIAQTRHRLIIVGIRKDHDFLYRVPGGTTLEKKPYTIGGH